MNTLKNVLLLNAVSSGATGIGILVFAPMIAQLFGVVQEDALYAVGIFLVAFAGFVLYEGSRRLINPRRIVLICALDSCWVIGSMIIVLLGLFDLSLIGYLAITGVALWVATMAFLQWKGIRQITV